MKSNRNKKTDVCIVDEKEERLLLASRLVSRKKQAILSARANKHFLPDARDDEEEEDDLVVPSLMVNKERIPHTSWR